MAVGVTAVVAAGAGVNTGIAPSDIRLVQYSGIEHIGSISIRPGEVGNQVQGLVCEGFYVKWSVNAGIGYLGVWEHPGPEPEWEMIYAESHLADIPEFDDGV